MLLRENSKNKKILNLKNSIFNNLTNKYVNNIFEFLDVYKNV